MKKILIGALTAVLTLSVGVGCKKKKKAEILPVYTVTFVQEGFEDVTRSVTAGEALADIPQPQKVEGHTVVWDNVDWYSITADITVNAVVTANRYTIRYHVDNDTTSEMEQVVVYGMEYTLEQPKKDGFIFQKWLIKGTEFVFEEGTYLKAGDTELVPLFIEDENSDRLWSGLI